MDADTRGYLIIGAGIAGLSAAYHLGKDGRRVTVLEAGDGKDNASFNSTAEMNHDPDADWENVVSQFGMEGAKHLWALSDFAITELSHFAHQSGEPHFNASREPAHLFSYHAGERGEADAALLRRKYDFFKAIDAYVELDEAPARILPSFTSALTIVNEGATNNQMILNVLAREVREQGGEILHHKKAIRIEEHADGVSISTEDGSIYTAAHVIIATGDGRGLTSAALPIDRVRTFVVSYENHAMPAVFRESLMWDTDEPFHYIRSFAGSRLWIGGEDLDDSDYIPSKEHDEEKYALLEKYAHSVLGTDASYKRQAAWSGVFFPSSRGLPYIGPQSERIHLSIGFGGSGILTSFISGYLHAAWQRGEMLEYKPLFGADWAA